MVDKRRIQIQDLQEHLNYFRDARDFEDLESHAQYTEFG